ncbi:kell blood group glycoprotein [Brachionichthys hirsutus]|uniref:kell blood group glycoprotein n=1 Tax=Brachionichthys hirsutus TaxID=412623 RepID=UPI0036046766
MAAAGGGSTRETTNEKDKDVHAFRKTQQEDMLRMRESQRELERATLSQSEPERPLQPPPLYQLPLPTQDPSETQQQAQLQYELQLSEHRPQTKRVWVIGWRLLLLLLLGFSFCAAILGLIYYSQFQTRRTNQAGIEYRCLTPVCRSASDRLAMSADPFTHPCDYFLFTCGSDRYSPRSRGMQRGKGLPGRPLDQKVKVAGPQESTPNKGLGLRDKNTLDRRAVLLQYLSEMLESNDRPDSTAVQKARQFYHSCLDTRSIETAGAEPFLALIQKLGGWAVSGQWNQTDFNSTLSTLMKDYATFPFFSLRVGRDPNEITRGRTKRYIQIDQPDVLIPIEWNNKTQKSKAKTEKLRPFLASCQRYLALLGSPPSSSMIHVGVFISLSSELAVAATPLHHRLSKGQLYRRMTIRELQSRAPAIDWLRCLRAAFHPLALIEDDLVLLHNLPYIEQMSHIIGKWLTHELRNSGPLHTYMIFHLLHTLMPALDSRFSETANDLSVALGNSEGVAPRWEQCVLETERGFDFVLRDLLRERAENREVEDMVQNIFSSFKAKLHEFRWKDHTSLQFVMKKVQALISKLWITNYISNASELDPLFSKVSVGTQNFFSSYVQLLSLWQRRRSKLLTEQTDAADILSVTSFLLGDELLVPMGMFVPPFFHPTYPRAMNYGVIGFLIAKDILHLLLPDINSQSEAVYDVGECVWTHYLSVTQKAGQAGAFSLSAAQQQEVWVQYSALQIALQAYYRSLQEHPGDTSISGLSHTRLFLTSFTQVNCDSDPYSQLMPLEPSFLITVICAKSDLCPTKLHCHNRTQQHTLKTC